jgi:hypothetical protein
MSGKEYADILNDIIKSSSIEELKLKLQLIGY